MTSLIDDLVRKTGAVAGKGYSDKAEYHFTCPECGHPSSPKNPHCSFSEGSNGKKGGWHCFSCGSGGSIESLARLMQIENPNAPKYEPKHAEPISPTWWMGAKGDSIVDKAAAHPLRYDLWNGYKKLPKNVIDENKLGVGVLPASHCQHERLLVPIYDGTMLVGIRGRQFCCDCRGKWLAPGGTRLELMPMYGERYLKKGKYIWLVENAVDALQITVNVPDSVGLAIYSTSYWLDHWVDTLKKWTPACVIICLDNDLVGNGGDLRRNEFITEWLKTHNNYPKTPAAVKIGNLLGEAHIPTSIYKWGNAPFKADVGTLLKQYAI